MAKKVKTKRIWSYEQKSFIDVDLSLKTKKVKVGDSMELVADYDVVESKSCLQPVKELTSRIKRTDVRDFNCYYQYKFTTPQWLESIDNYESAFGIDYNHTKEMVIEQLVNEFKISLNKVVFGDAAGRQYVESLK